MVKKNKVNKISEGEHYPQKSEMLYEAALLIPQRE
jgi:hypothetical protein